MKTQINTYLLIIIICGLVSSVVVNVLLVPVVCTQSKIISEQGDTIQALLPKIDTIDKCYDGRHHKIKK